MNDKESITSIEPKKEHQKSSKDQGRAKSKHHKSREERTKSNEKEKKHHRHRSSDKNEEKGPSTNTDIPSTYSNSKIEKTRKIQENINDVVTVMESNVDKALERGEKLDDIEKTTEGLRVEAKQFKKNVRKARLHLWWKNKKMTIMIVLAAAAAISIGIIVLIIRFT